MDDCIFCQIMSNAASAHILFENDFVAAFLSLENHPLIVPKKHVRDIFELDDIYAAEIIKAAVVVAKATRATLRCDGINLIQSNGAAAGQDVFHFHLHIKPRWHDDSVNLSWNTDTVDENNRIMLCADIQHSLQNPQSA